MAARILKGDPWQFPASPLMQEMIDCWKRHGDRICFEDARTKKQSTFRQLLHNAGALSSTLRKLGQGPGKVVTVLSDSTVESLTTNFGIWLSGAAASPINPRLPTEEMLFFFKTCNSEVVYCEEELLDRVKDSVSRLDWTVTIVCPNRQDGAIDYYKCLEEGNSAEGILLDGWWTGKDHTLSVLFTSGTTGSPKGVLMRDEALAFTTHIREFMAERSIILLTTPMYWISHVAMNISSVLLGSKLVIASRMSVKEIMETITEYKPTRWFTGSAILLDICNEGNLDKYDFSSFECLAVGGSVFLPEHRRMITEKMTGNRHVIRCVFGSTETGLASYDGAIPDIDSPKLGSVGQVAKGVELKVVDTETGKIQPPYAIGEFCMKSVGLIKRYINKEITEKELDKDGFWHLGDLGYYDDEGNVFYSSRYSDVMKYRGQQIAPAELESILFRHPDVLEACVVGKTSIEEGDLPAAFIIKRPSSNLSEEEFYNYVAEHVIDEKKLRGGIYFVESLPKNPVGKVLRHELKKRLN